jgi:hypothetical protein
VSYFWRPLLQNQITACFAFHAFIVLHTPRNAYSLEKDTDVIALQKSPNQKAKFVIKYYKGKRRLEGALKVTIFKNSQARKDMTQGNVLKFLESENELQHRYNIYGRNCQNFARKLFNFLTPDKDNIGNDLLVQVTTGILAAMGLGFLLNK